MLHPRRARKGLHSRMAAQLSAEIGGILLLLKWSSLLELNIKMKNKGRYCVQGQGQKEVAEPIGFRSRQSTYKLILIKLMNGNTIKFVCGSSCLVSCSIALEH